MAAKQNTNKCWFVYMIACTDGSLYTGISTDVERRFEQHKNKQGAKYFYSHTPQRIIYIEDQHTRSSASQREYEIKALTRKQKEELILDTSSEQN